MSEETGLSGNDPFNNMTGDDFQEALRPENWKEVEQRLHTPTFEAVLHDGRLTLQSPDGQWQFEFERGEVEALTRFLNQYAGVNPLPAPTDPFETFQPIKVKLPDDDDEIRQEEG